MSPPRSRPPPGCSPAARPATTPPPRPTIDEAAGLAGCGPLTDSNITQITRVTDLRTVTSPTICTWTGHTGDATIDITYSWLKNNTLMFDRHTATALGYHTETFVTESFGGFYWHDPHDPGTCGASAAVTWWIHHRDHHTTTDSCPAAWQLIRNTVQLDG